MRTCLLYELVRGFYEGYSSRPTNENNSRVDGNTASASAACTTVVGVVRGF